MTVPRPAGTRATAAATSRRRRIAPLANVPGAQPFYGGQQPLVILLAGLAAAQVRGYSGEPAFRARSGESGFGVAVQDVERYLASRIAWVCGEQIIQPGRTGPPDAAASCRRTGRHDEPGCPAAERALAAEAVELPGDRSQRVSGGLPGQIVKVRTAQVQPWIPAARLVACRMHH